MHTLPLTEHRPAATTSSAEDQIVWSAAPRVFPASPTRAEDTEFPEDLTALSTRHLRILCNQTYRLLDRDFPPMDAVHQYEELVLEIERRELQAESRTEPVRIRSGFRDNSLFSRFELFSDGTMVGHVKYRLKDSHAVLIQTVLDPRFDAAEVEPALIRQVLLNAHRRRVAVVPYCPRVRGFLTEFPQYRTLLLPDQRRRLDPVLALAVASD